MSFISRLPRWNAFLISFFLSFFTLSPAFSSSPDVPKPVIVAESEAFEVVGRFLPEGLVLLIDRAETNQPVLGAILKLEADGRNTEVIATFRPERGDYLVAPGAWLEVLLQPGGHTLTMLLQAGEDNDLLAAQWLQAEEAVQPLSEQTWIRRFLMLAVGIGLFLIFRRRFVAARSQS